MSEKYYSTQELIKHFRVSRHSIYRANKSGALPIAKREGSENYYSETDVKRYLERSATEKGKL